MIEHAENQVERISETRLDLECSSSVFNKHASSENAKQLGQNQSTLSVLSFGRFAFFQNSFSLNTGLERSRSDLVFELSGCPSNFIFGMLC